MTEKMKKILSAVIAFLTFLEVMAYQCSAEEIIDQLSVSQAGSISVEYSMTDEYVITIPADIVFTDPGNVETGIQASNVKLNAGHVLNVTMESMNGYKMKNGDAYIGYTVKLNKNEAVTVSPCTIMTILPGETSAWVLLDFCTDLNTDNAWIFGVYSDILTFTVSIESQ